MADQTPRVGRGIRIALFTSLALNLLVIGLLVGALAKGPNAGRAPSIDLNVGPLMGALSQDDRRALREEIGRQIDVRPLSPRARRAFVQNTLVALRAEPFDADAMLADLQRRSSHMIEVTSVAQETFVSYLAGLSQAERLALADALEAEMRNRSHKDGDRNGPPRNGGRHN